MEYKPQDIINACFELLAGFFVLDHCRVLIKDKKVRGVSLLAIFFFFAWGIWNLYYYPFLNQWASFVGGVSITTANLIYICLLVYYTMKEKKSGL